MIIIVGENWQAGNYTIPAANFIWALTRLQSNLSLTDEMNTNYYLTYQEYFVGFIKI